MKKNYFSKFIIIVLLSNLAVSQNDTQVLPSTLSENTTLLKNTTYTISDDIKISNGSTLTIEEGVILKSDNKEKIVFIIENGAKIIAAGSYDYPITAITKSKRSKEPTIVVKSSILENGYETNSNYRYLKIENPTVLMSHKPTLDTKVASSTSNF
ncbi:hypothetical protein [Aquimarina sediminis]|uniref:hypothetical protein n=1 Tax=Aquimarina sediminis TaxID=2070536 RepID=UPI000CA02D3D|nr:hypothetical protein [Aquimarina sediminis]